MAIKQAIHPQRRGFRPGWACIAVATAVASLALASPSQAQGRSTSSVTTKEQTQDSHETQAIRNDPKRSDRNARRGAPTRRLGGGSRGNDQTQNICPVGPQAMAMIAPEDNVTLTSAAQPSLMFYVNGAQQSRDVEFVLRDAKTDAALYSKLLKLPHQGGLVTLDMSELPDAPQLEVEGNYYWYLSLICDSTDRAKDIVVEGHVRRIVGNSVASSQLTQRQLPELESDRLARPNRLFTGLDNPLWHDTMAQLNQLRQSAATPAQRQAAQQRWQAILNADRELSIIAAETATVVEPLAIVDLQDAEWTD